MNNSKFRRKPKAPLCDELHEDDGINSRLLKRSYGPGKNGHRDQRLCKQIASVLSYIFSGACNDERLCALGVKSVEPAPDTSCLRITVFPLYDMPLLDPEEIIRQLKSANNYLRKEIASEICRRRVPEFTYRVIIDPDRFL